MDTSKSRKCSSTHVTDETEVPMGAQPQGSSEPPVPGPRPSPGSGAPPTSAAIETGFAVFPSRPVLEECRCLQGIPLAVPIPDGATAGRRGGPGTFAQTFAQTTAFRRIWLHLPAEGRTDLDFGVIDLAPMIYA